MKGEIAMIGILIVTHGNLGIEFLNTASIIIGKPEKVEALSLQYDEDVMELRKIVAEKISALDDGNGVLVFTDLFGGSPSNSVAINMRDMEFKAITGLNLPMLIESINMREDMDVDELTDHLREVGKDGIKVLNEIYKK